LGFWFILNNLKVNYIPTKNGRIMNIKEVELMKSSSNCKTLKKFGPHQPLKTHHFLLNVNQQLLTQPQSSHIIKENGDNGWE
jgi:hypothetical protein